MPPGKLQRVGKTDDIRRRGGGDSGDIDFEGVWTTGFCRFPLTSLPDGLLCAVAAAVAVAATVVVAAPTIWVASCAPRG